MWRKRFIVAMILLVAIMLWEEMLLGRQMTTTRFWKAPDLRRGLVHSLPHYMRDYVE
jgi:hypothetical protein